MILAETTVILSTGEAITAAEVFEGLALLAKNDSSFPLLTAKDRTVAVIGAAMDALNWAEERDVL